MINDFINQILNNFLKYSKLYLPLKYYKDEQIETFTIKEPSVLNLTTTEPDKPYLIVEDVHTLKMLLYSGTKDIHIDSKSLDIKDFIILVGGIDQQKNNYTYLQIFLNINYPALAYLSSQVKKDDILFSISIKKLGLVEDAFKILQQLNDDEAKINLARMYREENMLKKSLEVLNQITSKELEAQKNIEYGWLHLKTKKPQNSIKIFEYYKDIENYYLRQEVLFGLALSMIEISTQNIPQAIEILKEALELGGFSKREIMEKLAELHLNSNNQIKALEIYKQIYELTSDINLIPKILEISQSLDYELELVDELALFKIEDAKKFSKGKKIKKSNLKIVNSETQLKKHDLDPLNQEVLLVPEDITKNKKTTPKDTHKKEKEYHVNEMTVETKLTKTDEISDLAFKFVKEMEENSGKKISFSLEGIDEIERRIRILSMTEIREDEMINFLNKASYFFIYIVRERFKAKIKIIKELDMWATTVTIRNKNDLELTTYPAARLWHFRWSTVKPPHGYLRSYVEYLNSFMNKKEEDPYGKIAISKGFKSDEQKIFDAQIEHKKILETAKDIQETSYLSPNSSLLPKFEKELRKYFKPQIPPTTDGWKILRCFGHIFLEMILKDFSPAWYCVEKNDGLWSFMLPNKTFIFPVGKVYKSALVGESLQEYYEILKRNKVS